MFGVLVCMYMEPAGGVMGVVLGVPRFILMNNDERSRGRLDRSSCRKRQVWSARRR